MAIQKFKEDTREVILRFKRSEPGTVELTEKQNEMLIRWTAADELIRTQMFSREEVARQLMQRFEYSRDTAFSDMSNAEHVFFSSAPLHKGYEIGLRIELLKELIAKAAGKWPISKNDKGEDVFNTYIDYKAIAMLEKTLQGYYELYPTIREKGRPAKTVFNVLGNLNVALMSPKEASQKADQITIELNETIDPR